MRWLLVCVSPAQRTAGQAAVTAGALIAFLTGTAARLVGYSEALNAENAMASHTTARRIIAPTVRAS